MRTLRLSLAGAVGLALLGGLSAAGTAQPDDVKPAHGAPGSGSDRWAIADLSAFEAAFESGDYEKVRALFTDDGILTTAWNTIGLYYGQTAELGTWDVNGSEFRRLAALHGGQDFTVLGTPIQVGDNTVAFGWAWPGVSGTALLHLRDGKIVVAILNPSQVRIPFQRDMPAE